MTCHPTGGALCYPAMKPAWKAILFFLFSITALMGLGTALFIGFGALLTRWLPLSLFQATGLAICATLAVAAVIHGLSAIMHSPPTYDYDDDFKEDDDDFDPTVPDGDTSSPEPDFSKVGRNDYCPCGSGKKFKSCCENTIVK
jgi:hypothetical protein